MTQSPASEGTSSGANKKANAIGLYMEGIRDGNAEAALDKYLGARYTQHSTGVADGKEGFLEFFLPFLERNPVRDIRVARTFVDGNHVFVHAHQNLNNGEYYYVTADIFDTDENDRIVEHWDVIQEEVRETVSGRSMFAGPTEVEDEERTEDNRRLVTAFANDVLVGGAFDRAGDFVSQVTYHQHSPSAADGLDGFASFARSLAAEGRAMRYEKVHKILCQGNLAATLSHVFFGETAHCVIDIFRMAEGKIVEHWDVVEKIAPQDQWKNSGKF